jgi:hypothetical protein
MKLVKARVRNFRSAEDSGTFDVGDLTCLVGKNEAGKTAILTALFGSSASANQFSYDTVRDYPRRFFSRYDERHDGEPAPVATLTWELSDEDRAAVADVLGAGALSNTTVDVTTDYSRHTTWSVQVDSNVVRDFLLEQSGVAGAEREKFSKISLERLVAEANAHPEPSDELQAVKQSISAFRKGKPTLAAIDVLHKRMPVFFYTSHFDRMSGEISLEKLSRDTRNGDTISPGDQIFLDFLEYAGTSVSELQASTRLEELNARCQAASNEITEEMFEFWSQNDALSVEIILAQGLSEDPAPFNAGTVAKIRIRNDNHKVSVPLSERSAGFVWFFSFLSQFKQMRKKTPGAVILLDEPGLTLHGKAQADLLRYIIERLLPEHQVIYSTHSPFMVPADRLEDVRVVEDVVTYDQRRRPAVKGTQVSADVLSVDQDTLFPLQAHLGYEVTQSLFVGAHTLLVEGPSDVLYLQAASQALKQRKRHGLDRRWVICPTGGIDKVQSFASLFAGKGINIVALCDYGSGDKTKVQRLRTSQILKSTGVLVATDFTGKDESDVEDFFAAALYAEILNGAYALKGKGRITAAQLSAGSTSSRQVKQAESLFNVMDSSVPAFDHFSPASWLIQNQSVLAEDTSAVNETLDRFERLFVEINSQLPAGS